MRTRIAIAVPGVLLMLTGVLEFALNVPVRDLLFVALWLAGAVVLHDAVLSPALIGVGALVSRRVPPRARRFLQGFAVAAGLVVVIALPLIYRRGTQPTVKASLLRDYGANLALLAGLIAAGVLALYAVRVARDRRREVSRPADEAGERPAVD
ncbi:MAG: hypothetical protein ACRDVG_14780 [Jatrophihabitantaceae bacterium]